MSKRKSSSAPNQSNKRVRPAAEEEVEDEDVVDEDEGALQVNGEVGTVTPTMSHASEAVVPARKSVFADLLRISHTVVHISLTSDCCRVNGQSNAPFTCVYMQCAREVVSDAGIVESITLKNFMCHSLLGPFTFGSNVNFVVGNNGSECNR